jgi:hypothetical protein
MSIARTLDPTDAAIMGAVLSKTMVGPDRLAAVIDAARYVVRHGIPGALVECGVWRGGCAMAMALAVIDESELVGVPLDRDLWLYDTFTGMTAPTEVDLTHTGKTAAEVLARFAPGDPRLACGLDEVRANVELTDWPPERAHFVAGPVEDTLPGAAPERIALLRLDTDWYASTRHELEHLFPRLVSGGVLIIDDYGHWQGSRRAVDEYFAAHGVRMLLARTDYTGRMGVKA